MLGDVEIRKRLSQDLLHEPSCDSCTLVLHEFNVCNGQARIDIALINESINGYEIKSDKDTLDRLPGQIEVYGRVFDTVTLVVGAGLYKESVKMVPKWWGIKVATECCEDRVRVEDVREPGWNDEVDAFALAQFLWKDELVEIINLEGGDKRLRYQPRFKLWAYVADTLPLESIQTYVRKFMKNRPSTWRPDVLRMLNGD